MRCHCKSPRSCTYFNTFTTDLERDFAVTLAHSLNIVALSPVSQRHIVRGERVMVCLLGCEDEAVFRVGVSCFIGHWARGGGIKGQRD